MDLFLVTATLVELVVVAGMAVEVLEIIAGLAEVLLVAVVVAQDLFGAEIKKVQVAT